MRHSEHELISYLAGIKDRTIGFLELSMDLDEVCGDIHLDARYDLFTSECIFDDCSDTQAKLFLESFLANDLSVGWTVSLQLSKLLAKRGRLVSQTMDALLTTLDWSSYGAHQLFLSYLVVRADGAALAGELLDRVQEDARDGLFLACHRLQSEELDRKLMVRFVEWGAAHWDLGSTGEVYALEQFIAKWLGLYPYRDLEGVIRIYFRHRGEN